MCAQFCCRSQKDTTSLSNKGLGDQVRRLLMKGSAAGCRCVSEHQSLKNTHLQPRIHRFSGVIVQLAFYRETVAAGLANHGILLICCSVLCARLAVKAGMLGNGSAVLGTASRVKHCWQNYRRSAHVGSQPERTATLCTSMSLAVAMHVTWMCTVSQQRNSVALTSCPLRIF